MAPQRRKPRATRPQFEGVDVTDDDDEPLPFVPDDDGNMTLHKPEQKPVRRRPRGKSTGKPSQRNRG